MSPSPKPSADGRCAIIPGADPEIEVLGSFPNSADEAYPGDVARLTGADLRDDHQKFGDLANPLIESFLPRLSATWYRFNSIACAVEDVTVNNRLMFHGGLPVICIGNLRWELKAAEMASRGELVLDKPKLHYPGVSGVLLGRSAFNYYHFIADILMFIEDLIGLVESQKMERIIINPCSAGDDGFQRALIAELYPEYTDRIIFSDQPFTADRLIFPCLWPGVFGHGAPGGVLYLRS